MYIYIIKHQDSNYTHIRFTAKHSKTGLETLGNIVINASQTSSFQAKSYHISNKHARLFTEELLTRLRFIEDFLLNDLIIAYNKRIELESVYYKIQPIALNVHIDLENKHIKKNSTNSEIKRINLISQPR